MSDQNFDIPVQGSSYSGSSRAKSAVKSATAGNPVVSAGDKSSQSDEGVKDPNVGLKQDSQPKVLNTQAQPAAGATPPNTVNPSGRPGLDATKPKTGRF